MLIPAYRTSGASLQKTIIAPAHTSENPNLEVGHVERIAGKALTNVLVLPLIPQGQLKP